MTNYIYDNKHIQNLTVVLMLSYCIAIFIYAVMNPAGTWDMLGYAASAYSLTGMDVNEIHNTVFADLKAYASPATYNELTASSHYRSTMSSDPEAFSQQIPFYKIRFVFVLMILALSKMGIGIFESLHLVTAAFSSLGILILFLGLRRHTHSLLWFSIPVLYFGLTSDFLLIQRGGVDTLAFFWMALTFLAYIRGFKYLLPLLALSVLIRTDLILHAAFLFGVLLLTDRKNWKQLFFWGFVTLLLYFGVNHWAGNYGWRTLIHFSFVSDMSATHPAEYSKLKTFGWNEYLGFILNLNWISKWFWISSGAAIVSLLVFATVGKSARSESAAYPVLKKLNIVCFLSIAYIVVHYLLFPAIFLRFFIGSCLFMFIAMLSTMSFKFLRSP